MDHPQILEPHCAWQAQDVADPAAWTIQLSPADIAEIEAAMRTARAASPDLLRIGREDFPLPRFGATLHAIGRALVEGRGFVRLRGLDRARYSNDDLCLIYWGIGMHLGRPWPQNKHGHLLGDVTDQGRKLGDPEARGNELGGIKLNFHCDGADLVGLMCLQTGVSGGLSAVANSVAMHNDMVRARPDLAAELYKPQPYDFRGEQKPGGKPYYEVPVFTAWEGRLFVRLIAPYIYASQRHAEAPRLTDLAREALAWLEAAAESGRYSVVMELQPGDMQFINNYHVLHGRTAYTDDRATGRVRHLKRLWLETPALSSRPPYFRNTLDSHWAAKRVISRLDAAIG
jgi:hypothetical protein